jgi:hypothetical protein
VSSGDGRCEQVPDDKLPPDLSTTSGRGMSHQISIISQSCLPLEAVGGLRDPHELERGALHELSIGHRRETQRRQRSARD